MRRLVDAAGDDLRSALVVGTYDGRAGHPVLLGREHWAGRRRRGSGDVGARPVLAALPTSSSGSSAPTSATATTSTPPPTFPVDHAPLGILLGWVQQTAADRSWGAGECRKRMHPYGGRMQVAARTEVGHVRARNEDALLVAGEDGLVAVFDGLGGHPAGDVASATAAASLRESGPERRVLGRRPGSGPAGGARRCERRG